MDFERRCWAQVDLDILRDNFTLVQQAAGGTPVMAVVKADAYGHGDEAVARLLAKHGAAGFAVSGLEEALRLRRAGISLPILILGYVHPRNAAALADNRIAQCVYSTEFAQQLSAQAAAAGKTVTVHIKVDTGMGRLGFAARQSAQQAADEIAQICALPGLAAEGIFMHYAVADSQSEDNVRFTREQYEIFSDTVSLLDQRGIRFAVRHCCNSAGTFMYPQTHLDMVRAGIILYGQNPSDEVSLGGLRNALQLKAVVSMVKTIPAGCCVSYGRTYCAAAPTRVATITVGYADGYPRAMSSRGTFSIHGKPAKIIGRVCMDQVMVDVSDIPQVQMGDEVIVFGGGAADTVDELASMTDTISYEILCGLGRRVQHVYVENGQEISMVNYLR